MDLIRMILLTIEEGESAEAPWTLEIKGYSEDQVRYHVWLLEDAGLLSRPNTSGPLISSRMLTWAGHEFINAVRNDTVWNKTKEFIKDKGGSATFEVIKQVVYTLAKQHFGFP
jgi:hypothetical protein